MTSPLALAAPLIDYSHGGTGSGTGGSGDVTGPASATSGNFASFNGTTGKIIQDSLYSAGSFAPAGLVSIVTTSQAPNAAAWAACKSFTVLSGSPTFTIPASATLATNGCIFITNVGASTLAANAADTITSPVGTTGAGGTLSLTANQLVLVTTDGGGHLYANNYIAPASGLTVGSTAIASGTTTRILYDNAGVLGEYTLTGTGTVVAMQTSPSFTTPTLGVATATSINKLAITAPATSATLVIGDGKTFTAANSLTLIGTDSTTMTFPSTSATIARTDALQTFTGLQTFGALTATGLGTFSQAGGTSSPGLTVTGTPNTGNATTSFPQTYLNNGSAVSSFDTAGTMFGINTPNTVGTAIDVHKNGGGSVFSVANSGLVNAGASIIANGGMEVATSSSFFFNGGKGGIFSSSNGVINVKDNAGTGGSAITFGPATTSFAGIFPNATELQVKLGDNSAFAPIGAVGFINRGSVPTITGTCTGVGTQVGGNTAGTFVATCVAQTIIFTFATTAPNGWNCNAQDRTTVADKMQQTASSNTTATLTGTTVAADVIGFDCHAY